MTVPQSIWNQLDRSATGPYGSVLFPNQATALPQPDEEALKRALFEKLNRDATQPNGIPQVNIPQPPPPSFSPIPMPPPRPAGIGTSLPSVGPVPPSRPADIPAQGASPSGPFQPPNLWEQYNQDMSNPAAFLRADQAMNTGYQSGGAQSAGPNGGPLPPSNFGGVNKAGIGSWLPDAAKLKGIIDDNSVIGKLMSMRKASVEGMGPGAGAISPSFSTSTGVIPRLMGLFR